MGDLHITSVFGKRGSENTGASFRHSNLSVHLRLKQSEVHMQATAADTRHEASCGNGSETPRLYSVLVLEIIYRILYLFFERVVGKIA